MSEKEKAGDEHMGAYVYCRQHVHCHSTGWCTVSADDKIPLKATTHIEAVEECKANGWRLYPSKDGVIP